MERQELTQLRTQDVAIAELATLYMPLKINGINDKAGFDAVHKARMIVKTKRVDVEKLRKELKADALEYGKQVDAEAKRITGMIEPIEKHLEAEENSVLAEKERIKQAEVDAKNKRITDRIQALLALGANVSPIDVANWTDETFQGALKTATEAKTERERIAEVERLRLSAEAEARRIESEKLAAERAALDFQRREQEAEANRLKWERDKIEAKAAEQRRAIELENAKREAAEKSRIETEQRISAEQARAKQEAIAREARLKEEEEARQQAKREEEAAKPYRKKLKELADEVAALTVPDGPRFQEVTDILVRAAGEIRTLSAGPMPRAKRRETVAV